MGGHAFVYECVDRYVNATIAVKVIPNAPGRGKDILTRARAEASLLFKLNHPNVVRVTGARPVGDKMVCILMEKLEGLSLRQFLRLHRRFTVTEALLVVRQIAAGVGAAHKLDVIHRDIKPENVFLLPPDNQVKVLDFGIAKFLGQGLETTNKLRVHGTPLYMSPEHLQSSNITHRSDIYELGGVAFELMTGKIPCLVDLDNPNFQQMAYVQIMKATPPVSRLIRDVGPRTEQLIKRATAKDPAQRFASMQEVIEAADEALIEQKTLYPRESETIRYVDEAMIQAAKFAEQRTDEDDDGWEPIHDAPSSPPPKVARHVPTLGMRAANPIESKPPVEAEARPKVPVMAPTVELDGKQTETGDLPRQSQSPVALASAAAVPLSVVVPQSEPASRSSSLSSLTLYATNNSFSRELTAKTSWFQVPLPIVALTILLGLAIAFAISWPDIQKVRAKRHTAAQAPTAQTVATQAPVAAVPSAPSVSPAVSAEALSAPAQVTTQPALSASAQVTTQPALSVSAQVAAPPTLSASAQVAAPPALSASAQVAVLRAHSVAPVSTLAVVSKPKAPSTRPPQRGIEIFSSDNEPPTVTKAELDRMRAREKALAADLDREAASAKKAKKGAAP
jgi:serine/threonine-protein kinase